MAYWPIANQVSVSSVSLFTYWFVSKYPTRVKVQVVDNAGGIYSPLATAVPPLSSAVLPLVFFLALFFVAANLLRNLFFDTCIENMCYFPMYSVFESFEDNAA